ncbi:TPA: DUF968 domain-containing protein [Providencia alcalifaciens]
MIHQWILTPIIIPEVKAVMFKPGASLGMFSGRMLITTLPDELKHQPSGLISSSQHNFSDEVNGELVSKPVLNLTIDAEPPASFMKLPKFQRWESVKYLQWVKSQPCCVCGATYSELHKDPKQWEQENGSQLVLLFKFLDRSIGLGVFGW